MEHEIIQQDKAASIVRIHFDILHTITLLYIAIPVLIFFVTWLKWYIGISAAMLLSFGIYHAIKLFQEERQEICLPVVSLLVTLALLAVWVAYSGVGGFFFQTGDNHWRNAIFRDLINYDWPVIYPETNNALVYYLMYWIIPALIGKMTGWAGANVALYFFTVFGIWLIFLQLLCFVNVKKSWHIWTIALLLIVWSGENVVGLTISNMLHICVHPVDFGSAEGWLDYNKNGFDCSYLYRSNIDALCQVYNQAVVPWLVAVMVLNERKTRIFALCGLLALCYGPMPFIGVLPIFAVLVYEDLKDENPEMRMRQFFARSFSIPNLTAAVTIFPIFLFYYSSNVAFNSSNGGHFIGLFVPTEAFDTQRWVTLLLFWLLEFGIYALFIWKKYKTEPVFWTIIVTLILIPFFKIGAIRDFCMNASLPSLMILMAYTGKYIIEEYRDQFSLKFAIRYVGLLAVLLLSCSTLFCDCVAKLQLMNDWNVFPYVADDIVTLSDKKTEDEWMENYLVPDWEETAFYNYLARRSQNSTS